MVSKSTIQLGFRFPIRYLDLLNDRVKRSSRCRADWCRYFLTWASEQFKDDGPPIKKLLWYNKVKRDRARLSGKSIVIAVRLPHQVADSIKTMAARDGNNISEWCGLLVLDQLTD